MTKEAKDIIEWAYGVGWKSVEDEETEKMMKGLHVSQVVHDIMQCLVALSMAPC